MEENISYDPKKDELEGLEDLDEGQKGDKVANHASVFMTRSVTQNWKQPIGYFLTNSTMIPKILAQKIKEGIKKVQATGLRPIAIVMDQGSNNQSAMKLLGCTATKPYFYVDGFKIYTFFDPPHLLKNIKTNFKNHGFVVAGKEVKWVHLEQFYRQDSSRPIRMAPKLSQKHLDLGAFKTMSVPLAAQVNLLTISVT